VASDTKKTVLPDRQRSFLNKDFNSLRGDLLEYARTYFPDKIQDFSEASVGGLLLDLAAYVGDVNSFYLDHQFKELDPNTAVEDDNIQRMLRMAGVKIEGASPAVTGVKFLIEVPAERKGSLYQPKAGALPIIRKGTIVSTGDVSFNLVDDLDFSKKDKNGNLVAGVKVLTTDTNGIPTTYTLSLEGTCASGTEVEETFSIPDSHVPFRTLTLSNADTGVILSVIDSSGNEYYEVDSLTQDTVFVSTVNLSDDNLIVKDNLDLRYATRRFTSEMDFQTKQTTLRFGSGNELSTDTDAIPDPSDLSLPLYGKKSFSRFTIDPAALLNTSTLGISPRNTTLTVRYRYGGGLDHNVGAETIASVETLLMDFDESVGAVVSRNILSSTEVTNDAPATGGSDAPTMNDLRSKISPARNAQSRIVTKQDLLARIYTLPSQFGRVFRAGIRPNENNPNASQLFVISRDDSGNLIASPDTLKKNLVKYLNEFRLISDAIDILDAQVLNVGIDFQVAIDPSFNQEVVLQDAIDKISDYMEVENFQIDQPIILSDLNNLVFNTSGVLSVIALRARNLSGIIKNRKYSDSTFNVLSQTRKGIVFPPSGGMFELKFEDFDIRGTAL
jgi:hypothetical protein